MLVFIASFIFITILLFLFLLKAFNSFYSSFTLRFVSLPLSRSLSLSLFLIWSDHWFIYFTHLIWSWNSDQKQNPPPMISLPELDLTWLDNNLNELWDNNCDKWMNDKIDIELSIDWEIFIWSLFEGTISLVILISIHSFTIQHLVVVVVLKILSWSGKEQRILNWINNQFYW